ncbi:MAG: hypothetical protein IKJ99_03685 [Oscillospiraceae bacterium]|nr:hypothetical protein [Oscillospiraceae bacterium]
MAKVKASTLKQGDVIRVVRWSNLWMRMAPTTATVMDVTVFGKNLSIMAKVKDGMNEFVSDIFTAADFEYEKIA